MTSQTCTRLLACACALICLMVGVNAAQATNRTHTLLSHSPHFWAHARPDDACLQVETFSAMYWHAWWHVGVCEHSRLQVLVQKNVVTVELEAALVIDYDLLHTLETADEDVVHLCKQGLDCLSAVFCSQVSPKLLHLPFTTLFKIGWVNKAAFTTSQCSGSIPSLGSVVTNLFRVVVRRCFLNSHISQMHV